MKILSSISFTLLMGFIFSVILSPFIIKLTTKIKFNQPVYEYVELHQKKSGTPTMGGLIFLISIALIGFFFTEQDSQLVKISVVVMLAFGLIGFLDDFLKIKLKNNEGGLKPYQKILSQLIIAIIVSVYAYNSKLIMGEIYIPFTTKVIHLGWLYIPLVVIFFLAITNSVNLTDGLDGLAGGVSLNYVISFSLIFFVILYGLGNINSVITREYYSILTFCGGIIGALLGYLLYNSHPATIFMGDTGSLALGGLLGTLAIFTKTPLLVPFLGIMFVVSAVSVIIQVLHYKRTKKRIFLMAPFHHHLEKKSMYETKIVTIYMIITIIVGILCLLLQILLT